MRIVAAWLELVVPTWYSCCSARKFILNFSGTSAQTQLPDIRPFNLLQKLNISWISSVTKIQKILLPESGATVPPFELYFAKELSSLDNQDERQ